MIFKEKLLAIIFTPLILYGYYYTQHDAFLYLYGFILHLCVLELVIISIMFVADADLAEFVKSYKDRKTPFNIVLGYTYNLGGLVFLLYYEKFYLSTIMIIFILLNEMVKISANNHKQFKMK